jgi:hypothetical protein
MGGTATLTFQPRRLEPELDGQSPWATEYWGDCTGYHFPTCSVYLRNQDLWPLRASLKRKRTPVTVKLLTVHRPPNPPRGSSRVVGAPGYRPECMTATGFVPPVYATP